MSTPHKCPVCNGTGKITIYESVSTNAIGQQRSCNACNGSGVVWEPQELPGINTWPVRPFVPNPPTFDHVIPLTFPKDFKFPEDIQEASKEKLITMLEDWLKDLKKE